MAKKPFQQFLNEIRPTPPASLMSLLYSEDSVETDTSSNRSKGWWAQHRRWTIIEEKYLHKKYGKDPIENIAVALDRTIPAVYYRAVKLGLQDK